MKSAPSIKIMALGFIVIAGLSGAFLFGKNRLSRMMIKPVTRGEQVSYPYISDAVIATVRKDKSVHSVFRGGKAALITALGPEFSRLSETDLRAVFCTVVSNRMAPYGTSTKMKLDELLREKVLDCDNYAVLACILFDDKKLNMQIVGFEGGAVGNHAQLFYTNGNTKLLLDPTIGLVALAGFNDVLRGKPVPSPEIRIFGPADSKVGKFARIVMTSIRDGKYRPSDLLYYYESVAHLEEQNELLTEKGKSSKYRWLATPGGVTLHKRQ